MSMSLKNFVALADMICHANSMCTGGELPVFDDEAISFLATFCAQQNFRFNRDRWIDYINGECNVNGKAVK